MTELMACTSNLTWLMRFSLAKTAGKGWWLNSETVCVGIFPDERKLHEAGINHRIIHVAALINTFNRGKEKLQEHTAIRT